MRPQGNQGVTTVLNLFLQTVALIR